ncbi:MAG: DNA methyltransferase [Lentisphaerota bacterium]
MRGMESGSVDAVVTDPPAGIGFMGMDWDEDRGGRDAWIAWLAGVMSEALRVLKPGGHALVWALPRTAHWTGMALENAGFEVRDQLSHFFGSGFPKSLDVSKAIDKAAGAEREVIGVSPHTANRKASAIWGGTGEEPERVITAPATPAAVQWDGWGTALKPGHEVWWLCRKPFKGTVAGCVLEHGTGAINVDGCRVGTGEKWKPSTHKPSDSIGTFKTSTRIVEQHADGRFPPNILFTHSASCTDQCAPDCPVAELDRQSGQSTSGADNGIRGKGGIWSESQGIPCGPQHNDTGTPSRFFPVFRYEAKPSRAEREAGCEHLLVKTAGELVDRADGSAGMNSPRAGAGRTSSGRTNHHPTVKPVELMRWLVRLITPSGGTVLDPFTGSGTTGIAAMKEGMNFIGIELSEEYTTIARARIEAATRQQDMFYAGDAP